MSNTIQVGTVASPSMLSGDFATRQRLISSIADSGIDHVFGADHVSFHKGLGMDAMINAATIVAMHPTLKFCLGVYLLALRHPVPVARQLATLAQSAPGRIILGIGVGGEDRHEMEVCGIDPRTRGRRTDDCLAVIRELMTGQKTSFNGDFFEFTDAIIRPKVSPSIPILVGGRSDKALQRAARFAEGWLGVWCSPSRFKNAINEVSAYASEANRPAVNWQHGMQIWVGVNDDEDKARALISQEMEAFYKVPFKAFEKYSPYGSAEKIADFLRQYQQQGCSIFNIKPCAATEEEGIATVARVKSLLAA